MKSLLKNIFAVLILTVLCSFFVLADDGISVYLNGEVIEFETAPQIIDGRTMVPIRAIFEKMGAEVTWNDSTKTAKAVKDGTSVSMTVDKSVMYVNGKAVSIEENSAEKASKTRIKRTYKIFT